MGPELRNYANRIEEGDETLLTEEEDELSGAFIGELLRAVVDRATAEGERQRVQRLPWGIGAAFRRTGESRSTGEPGIFFATRTEPMPGAEDGYRYWRYVEATGEVIDSELAMLWRIDPRGSETADAAGLDLEGAWEIAARSIVDEHNGRADPRRERIGPAQAVRARRTARPGGGAAGRGRAGLRGALGRAQLRRPSGAE